MCGSGREKKKNVRRTVTAVFVAALILCGAFLLMFTSGDSFGKYTATESVHGTFAEDIEWTMLNEESADNDNTIELSNPAYHLEEDVNADITVAENCEVTLCLNGHILKGTGTGSVITVPGTSTLHLCDCNSTNGKYFYTVDESTGLGSLYNSTGTLIKKDDSEYNGDDYIDGGVVTGGNADDGGGIFVQSGGTLTMNSGYVFGNKTVYNDSEYTDSGVNFTGRGGGVCVLGSFTMTGGRIQHNTAECDGAGVYVYDGATQNTDSVADSDNGIFVMDGDAELCFNRCVDTAEDYGGGGVFLESGTFSMKGNSRLYDNRSLDYGGGVLVDGNNGRKAVFTMSEDASVTDNDADGPGAGVYMYGEDAEVVMNGGSISNNTAGSSGGGIFMYRGSVTLNGGDITYNTATTKMSGDGGGGVFVDGVAGSASLVMNSGSISNNTSGRDGGGVMVDYGAFTMNGGEVDSNTASGGGGGAVYLSHAGSVFNLNGGEVDSNYSSGGGGGVYVNAGADSSGNSGALFNMSDGTLSNNKNASGNSGGGVYINSGSMTMSGGEITVNSTTWGGAGIYIYSGGSFTMEGGDIHDNSSTSGSGAGVFVYNGSFTMCDGYICGNYAPQLGGGVYIDTTSASFTMEGGEISGNSADLEGGGVYSDKGTFTMNGGSIISNTTKTSGGGVYLSSSATFKMSGGNISLNTASGNGGGVYINSSSSSFTMSGGTVGGYEIGGGETTSLGNTADTGGGVYVNSGSFSISGTGEVCYNFATNSIGGVYINSNNSLYNSFEYVHGNIYNNDPGEVYCGSSTGTHSYPYPDADNIRDFVDWDWENIEYFKDDTDELTPDKDGYVGTVHVTVKCVCGVQIDEGDVRFKAVQYGNDTGYIIEKTYKTDDNGETIEDYPYVWYLQTETFYPENADSVTEAYAYYTGLYRKADASDEVDYFVPFYGQGNIPVYDEQNIRIQVKENSKIEFFGDDSSNDLFKITAGVDFNYSGGRKNNIEDYVIYSHPLSFTDMRGDTRMPDTGLVMASDIKSGDEEDGILTITAYDDIFLYVYLQLTNTSYNSDRQGYVFYSVNGGEREYIDRTSSYDKWDVIVLEIELKSGDVLTIGAQNKSSSNARLWFFGAEAYAIYGAGISDAENEEDGIYKVTLTDGDGNLPKDKDGYLLTDKNGIPLTDDYGKMTGVIELTVGEEYTLTVHGWIETEVYTYDDETKDDRVIVDVTIVDEEYGGSNFSWSASSYLYVAYDVEGGTITLVGLASSDETATTVSVTIGSISLSFDVIVKADSTDTSGWYIIEGGDVDFTNYSKEETILGAGSIGENVIKDSDGDSTIFTAIGKESDSTAIEIGVSTTVMVDEEDNEKTTIETYLKFSGSASTTKGVIKTNLKAGTYKIEIWYYNSNAGRWPVVLDCNGVRLGEDIYGSQMTTSDSKLHLRIVTFTIDEDMDIYIGSDNSGLYVTRITIYKLPGYNADVELTPSTAFNNDALELILDENSGKTSADITVGVNIYYTDTEGTTSEGYYITVVSDNEKVASVTYSSTTEPNNTGSSTFTVTAVGAGMTVVRVSVYAKDGTTVVKTVEFTIVVRANEGDDVEISYIVPKTGNGETGEASNGVFAKDREIESNYLFTVTNGMAHEMSYTVGGTYGDISANAGYIDMHGTLVTPDQAIYTEKSIEDSDDILRITARDNICLYVYVALADANFTSGSAGNTIYYYINSGDKVTYEVSSLADVWTIIVYLSAGDTLTIGYSADSGTNSALYFFGAEARTYTAKDSVSIDISVNGSKVDSGTGRLELTIYDNEYLEDHTVDGEIVDVDFSVMSGTIEIGVISDVAQTIDYEVVVEIVGNGVATIVYDESTGIHTVTAKGEGVTYVLIAVKVDGVVVAMEKVEVVVTVFEEPEGESGEGDGTYGDASTENP